MAAPWRVAQDANVLSLNIEASRREWCDGDREEEKEEAGALGRGPVRWGLGMMLGSRGLFSPHRIGHVWAGVEGGRELRESSRKSPPPLAARPLQAPHALHAPCFVTRLLLPRVSWSLTSRGPAKCPLLWVAAHPVPRGALTVLRSPPTPDPRRQTLCLAFPIPSTWLGARTEQVPDTRVETKYTNGQNKE